jgi:hypothetical protein
MAQKTVYKEQYADVIKRQVENFQKEAEVEHLRRDMHEFRKQMDEMIQIKATLSTEMAITKMRLEMSDPSYRYEQTILIKVANAFRKTAMTPDQLFTMMDKDHDGSLSHSEFKSALDQTGVDLS